MTLTPLRVVALAVVYFAAVFAVGFVLGVVRVMLVMPAIGERAAELTEMPFMIAASLAVAWRLVRRWPLTPPAALVSGVLALALLLGAELAVVVAVRGVTIAEYVATRDPVGGFAYAAALGIFTLAPAFVAWRLRGRG